MAQPLVILGASARAAAFSACRAGFAPWTADLFADADLAALCPARRVTTYPAGLESAAREAPPGPWLYTGALENHPDLVDRIAAVRPLWGNSGEVLRRVRDPWQVREALAAEGVSCPEVASNRHSLARGKWMRKPRRSAGGARIEVITVDAEAPPPEVHREAPPARRRDHAFYHQQFIQGESLSAVFIAAAGRAQLLGVTRQLTGAAWAGARGFQYSGSIGPRPLSEEQQRQWARIGSCLARRFALTGLFGVDAVENEAGVFPVEVNPRYTASVEVLERSLSFHALTFHAAACRDGRLPESPAQAQPTLRVCGKAVLYAPRDGAAPESFRRFLDRVHSGPAWPSAADLPRPGELLRAGHPVITVFAEGTDEHDVEQRLRQTTAEIFAHWE
jgi:uncharacterized protein